MEATVKQNRSEYQHKRYLEKRDQILAAGRARYFEQNKSRILAQRDFKAMRAPKSERDKAYRKEWHQKNKEHQSEMEKARLAASPERRAKRVQSSLKWRSKNVERVKAYQREYQVKNPAKYVAAASKRRALKKKSAVNLRQIEAWMTEVRSKPTAICYYCSKRVSVSDIHFDHIIALSKGGPHSVENLCVACQPCNNHKSAKALRAWVKIGQQILEL